MIITVIIMMMTGATGNALQKTFTHPCRHWENVTCI